ncbi:peptidase S8/S53 domain-containing protein [Tricladium varicosporioides]|nr:peptidase S8/S53 domain-containing protein [Hymenoscyphus varicosporioides]
MRKSTSSLSEVSRGQLSGQTPYQYRLYLLSKSNVTNAKEDIVAQDIKAFCLRNLRRDDAIKVLYERGKEKHIEFDLSSLPSSRISKGDLVQLARHLNFEDTLMYVALPKLHVEDSIQDSDHAHYDSNSLGDSLGRTDVNVIFQWLWDNGVRRIFKVIVIDDGNDGDVPHSNQAIEDALVQFKIETWDWKKIDICSNTIVLAAGEHVRVIYLYSSGNSAVLRSWSCEAGLVKLKLLEKVHLVIRRGLETEIRRNQDVEDFQTAFQENWKKLYPRKEIPEMTIIMDDKPKSYALGFRINKIPEQKQEWLSRMDMFASFISTIDLEKEKDKRNQERVQAGLDGASEDEKPKAIEDIKVAVIDDGIDGFGNDLSGSIAHGVSFCRSSDSENLIRTYYVSSGGHGTKMARLIRRICPTVKLYVARLEEYRSSGKRFITARSATEAVNWAVTNGVHIISMSWSIEGTEEQQDIKELKKAIEAAKRANITMFCAFSDQGTNSSEKTFPGYWASECMTIGAATAMGDASTLVDQNRVSFLFPGEQIVIDSKEPDPSSLSSPPKAENGSSISTALAAGTAALLLFITQLVNPQFFEKLREPARMKRAFKKFCPEANQKYFKAQDHFSKSFETDPSWTWEIEGKEKVTILVNNLMTQAEQQSDTYW